MSYLAGLLAMSAGGGTEGEGRETMTESQKKWIDIFARPEPQTSEDVRTFADRLNRWYWLMRFGVCMEPAPKPVVPVRPVIVEEVKDLDFWTEYAEYVQHVNS